LVGRPFIVSPREFEAIASWRLKGIPVAVVCEVIEAAGRRRSGRAPRALTALAPAVLEAWEVVAAGRAVSRATGARRDRSAARRAWEEALGRVPSDDRLHTLLTGLLAQNADGRADEAVDATLDASLPAAVPEDLARRVRDETAEALHPFRARMSDAEFRGMFDRAFADRLRAELKLPRLSLTP
jgi:hypothetical protein